MIKIAVYGKGGIGKSTTTANVSAALSTMGYSVMQIGCDPKSDSTKCLMNGVRIPTVLDQIREKGPDGVELSDIVFIGYNDILCVEAGGPTPGIGCAGRGIAAALMLGAEGVQMGTRFVVTKECHIHPAYKERILKAKDIDTDLKNAFGDKDMIVLN